MYRLECGWSVAHVIVALARHDHFHKMFRASFLLLCIWRSMSGEHKSVSVTQMDISSPIVVPSSCVLTAPMELTRRILNQEPNAHLMQLGQVGPPASPVWSLASGSSRNCAHRLATQRAAFHGRFYHQHTSVQQKRYLVSVHHGSSREVLSPFDSSSHYDNSTDAHTEHMFPP